MANKSNKDQLRRMAYMDEELSVDEVIAYEESLSREAKAGLESDIRLEAAIGDRLAKSEGCPDPLWDKLKGHLVAQSTARLEAAKRPEAAPSVAAPSVAAPSSGWRRMRGPLSYVATAVAAALVAAFVLTTRPAAAHTEVVFTDDLAAFAMNADVPGEYEKVARGLVMNGFNVTLKRPGESHHQVEVLGMRMIGTGEHQTAQVYFSCCGRPVTVLLTKRENAAWLDTVDLKGMPPRWTEHHSMLDGYAVLAIGAHDPNEVAALFS